MTRVDELRHWRLTERHNPGIPEVRAARLAVVQRALWERSLERMRVRLEQRVEAACASAHRAPGMVMWVPSGLPEGEWIPWVEYMTAVRHLDPSGYDPDRSTP